MSAMAAGTALRVGALAAALAVLVPTAGRTQSLFNNWGRCTDVRLAPERRVEYCTRLLDSGGGPGSEAAALTLLGGNYRDMHEHTKALDAYSRALGYESLGVSDSREDVISPGSTISMPTAALLIGALEGRAEVYVLTGRRDLALADLAHIFKLADGPTPIPQKNTKAIA
jgi:hypothetical protein